MFIKSISDPLFILSDPLESAIMGSWGQNRLFGSYWAFSLHSLFQCQSDTDDADGADFEGPVRVALDKLFWGFGLNPVEFNES